MNSENSQSYQEFNEPSPQSPNFEMPATSGYSDVASIVRGISQELQQSILDFSHLLVGEQKEVMIGTKGEAVERWVKRGQSIVNEKGRWDIVAFLTSFATSWSNFEDFEVRPESADIAMRFVFDLGMKKEAWEVAWEDMSTLVIMVEKFVEYAILRKSSEKKMWDLAQRTIKEQHSYVESEKKGSPFNIFSR